MNRINHKFYQQIKRVKRWHSITTKLNEFEGLINDYDGASPEEIRKLRFIHERLYECYMLAKSFLEEVSF
ncbi:MAG: hypothetical protein IJT58_00530 [Synergistaceae bacterium]|nr:hypothetical protein [Synergistaceae bacterium]